MPRPKGQPSELDSTFEQLMTAAQDAKDYLQHWLDIVEEAGRRSLQERHLELIRETHLDIQSILESSFDMDSIPKWKDRKKVDPGLDSLEWFNKYWAPHVNAGRVFQREFRQAEHKLFFALLSQAQKAGLSISDYIPSRQPLLTRGDG